MFKNSFTLLVLFISSSLLAADPATNQQNVNAQDLHQKRNDLVGQQVSFKGKVDRDLGNGAFIVSDKSVASPNNKVLVLNTGPAQKLKEGENIQLQGKVEQLDISTASETVNPKSKTETIRESAAAIPVVVVQQGGIKAIS